MTLPPLKDRTIPNLEEELENLKKLLNSARNMFGKNITAFTFDALSKIEEAIFAIEREIESRR